tara:strand:+ start:12317 stop:12949 length:633 start_codon:yes stop_codon:yes gene_type:complete
MSIIYPGNFVARLNAYNGQGVEALPGVVFYNKIGYLSITSSTAEGDLGTFKVLSPDMRGDDKPRLDKELTVPVGGVIYRTALSVVNLKCMDDTTVSVPEAGATLVTKKKEIGGSVASLTAGATATSTSDANGLFPDATNAYLHTTSLTAQTTAIESMYATFADADDVATLELVDTEQNAGIIMEVCYYISAAAPNEDDLPIPFKTIAGSA